MEILTYDRLTRECKNFEEVSLFFYELAKASLPHGLMWTGRVSPIEGGFESSYTSPGGADYYCCYILPEYRRKGF